MKFVSEACLTGRKEAKEETKENKRKQKKTKNNKPSVGLNICLLNGFFFSSIWIDLFVWDTSVESDNCIYLTALRQPEKDLPRRFLATELWPAEFGGKVKHADAVRLNTHTHTNIYTHQRRGDTWRERESLPNFEQPKYELAAWAACSYFGRSKFGRSRSSNRHCRRIHITYYTYLHMLIKGNNSIQRGP